MVSIVALGGIWLLAMRYYSLDKFETEWIVLLFAAVVFVLGVILPYIVSYILANFFPERASLLPNFVLPLNVKVFIWIMALLVAWRFVASRYYFEKWSEIKAIIEETIQDLQISFDDEREKWGGTLNELAEKQNRIEELQAEKEEILAENQRKVDELNAETQRKLDEMGKQMTQNVSASDRSRYEKFLASCHKQFSNFPDDVQKTIATGMMMKEYLTKLENLAKSYEMCMFCIFRSVEAVIFSIYEFPKLNGYLTEYLRSCNRNLDFAAVCAVVKRDKGHDWPNGFGDKLDEVRRIRNGIVHKKEGKRRATVSVHDYSRVYDMLMGRGIRPGMLAQMNKKLMELRQK